MSAKDEYLSAVGRASGMGGASVERAATRHYREGTPVAEAAEDLARRFGDAGPRLPGVVIDATGPRGNVYYVIASANVELCNRGLGDEAMRLRERCFDATSYDAVLGMVREWVEVRT